MCSLADEKDKLMFQLGLSERAKIWVWKKIEEKSKERDF